MSDAEQKAFTQGRAAGLEEERAIPEEVKKALDRMCKPLHDSVLSGATAAADAYCMEVIRNYVMSTASPTSSDAGKDVCKEMRDICIHCGGTGDVHSLDGEWRGECNCEASQWVRDARDAARYRWISEQGSLRDEFRSPDFARVCQFFNDLGGQLLGDAIDEAMARAALSSLEVIGKGEKG